MSVLPEAFLARPIAHRALHGAGRPENSRAAVQAAVDAGYGIEIDVQLSSDGAAMVFHDYDLGRLTGARGPVRQRTASELWQVTLSGSQDGIPTLTDVLELVAGQVALLIEIKDQDGALGVDVGPLERAVADAVCGYSGPVAVMSFNPHSMAEMARIAPVLPRGLTTCAFDGADWPTVPEDRRAELRGVPDLQRVEASFVSHQASDLQSETVQSIKARGLPVLCWTIRSAEADAEARQVADNVTFEGYYA